MWRLSMGESYRVISQSLRDLFLSLVQRHVSKLCVRGPRATGLCPFHDDRNPSFSADIERCRWHCFGCGRSGGVKAFAELVGEPWGSSSPKSKIQRAVQARRRQAEEQLKETARHRREELEDSLLEQHREAHGAKVEALDILKLFHRHPELTEGMPELLDIMEQQYAESLDRLVVLEAKLDEELAARLAQARSQREEGTDRARAVLAQIKAERGSPNAS